MLLSTAGARSLKFSTSLEMLKMLPQLAEATPKQHMACNAKLYPVWNPAMKQFLTQKQSLPIR